jgi:hypothetical protein
MRARYKVTGVETINGQSHAELTSYDGGYILFYRPASDNVTKGQEFIFQSVEAAEEVQLLNLNTRRKFTLREPVNREEMQEEMQHERKDLFE